MELRCQITGNPCGTDTWQEDHPCSCLSCRRWMLNRIAVLEAELGLRDSALDNMARKLTATEAERDQFEAEHDRLKAENAKLKGQLAQIETEAEDAD